VTSPACNSVGVIFNPAFSNAVARCSRYRPPAGHPSSSGIDPFSNHSSFRLASHVTGSPLCNIKGARCAWSPRNTGVGSTWSPRNRCRFRTFLGFSKGER
jgi:hypothetical protein